MTSEEQISQMKKAIAQAIKVMGDRFGSTEQDVTRAIQDLKASMPGTSQPSFSNTFECGWRTVSMPCAIARRNRWVWP